MEAATNGINHLGLAVKGLDASAGFFINLLGWTESGRDESYPRTAVSDGVVRLTLWQADSGQDAIAFDRRRNIGLHHLALEVQSEDQLNVLANKLSNTQGVEIEFMPELLGNGPRKHMMYYEPGGIRIEFIWPGNSQKRSKFPNCFAPRQSSKGNIKMGRSAFHRLI